MAELKPNMTALSYTIRKKKKIDNNIMHLQFLLDLRVIPKLVAYEYFMQCLFAQYRTSKCSSSAYVPISYFDSLYIYK